MEETRGTLKETEPHPAAYDAMKFMKTIPMNELFLYQEAFSSCAIEGNRMGEICSETLDRLIKGLPVSDRYLLGLAWMIKGMIKDRENIEEKAKKSKLDKQS